jgi:hypothetical protein
MQQPYELAFKSEHGHNEGMQRHGAALRRSHRRETRKNQGLPKRALTQFLDGQTPDRFYPVAVPAISRPKAGRSRQS